jgi:hypothetical protein
LESTLNQRNELSSRLEKEEEVRGVKESEYKHKMELLAVFPGLMQKLKEASVPMHDYLDV